MAANIIDPQDAGKTEISTLWQQLSASQAGLSSAEAQERLRRYGRNQMSETKTSAILKFLGYFWGPIPWMIEVAAVLSLVVRHWADFAVISVLQLFNAMVGFWEEHKAADAKSRAEETVEDFAAKGYRALGVARTDEGDGWRFLGTLPLYDPPREDSAETIAQTRAHGIQVKMVTGDNTAIAAEISGQLGLGKKIMAADQLSEDEGKETPLTPESIRGIEQADGFAQVFPEHKYRIVKALQDAGHLVAMTGDGVNDAPALKQADVGIAVSGATDAARSTAALVLTAPGLSVIVKAVEGARRIFERMNSYAIYQITETIRIMFFMVLAMLVYNFYPITAIMVILLALLNDFPIMTIAYDNTWLDPKPVRWELHRVLRLASILGAVGLVETFALLTVAKSWLGIGQAELQSIIFLKLAVAGHLTLFVARSRRPFFARPHPAPALLGAILYTQAAAVLIVGFGWFVTPIPWLYIAAVWGYCLVWVFIEDYIKLRVYRHMGMDTPRHQAFLRAAKKPIGPHGAYGLPHAHAWHTRE